MSSISKRWVYYIIAAFPSYMIPAGIKDVVYILMLRLLHQFHDCKIQHKNIVNNFSDSSDCADDI